MWRPAHGATSRPGPSRPGGGYGRVVGRPGPRADDTVGEAVSEADQAPFDLVAFDGLLGVGVEQPAPVTP